MQEYIDIRTQDNKRIYGVLDQESETNKLIIFVHGLKGNMHRHLFFNAPKYFNPRGFATFRFSLYCSKRKARALDQCNLSIHINDLNEVLKYWQDKFKQIYLIGISLGGPVVLGADLNEVEKIVLWDPSVKRDAKVEKGKLIWSDEFGCYVSRSGVRYLISKEMVEDWESIDYNMWTENCQTPTKVISAGRGPLVSHWNKLVEQLPFVKEYKVIEEATHNFDEDGVEDQVYEETYKFFKL